MPLLQLEKEHRPPPLLQLEKEQAAAA